MGFEIFGLKFFDFSQPFGYPDTFGTIIFVCLIAFGIFYVFKFKSKK
ncbi:hypothetical protein [Helicobacter sp. 13S00477-4]|nr:hypothetical protein [Helicobacter sp. 13S00477-4]